MRGDASYHIFYSMKIINSIFRVCTWGNKIIQYFTYSRSITQNL